MSSLTSVAQQSGPAPTDLPPKPTGVTRRPDLILGLLGAAGLAILAGTATGGYDLPPNTWVEVALVTIGAILAGALVIRRQTITGWAAVALGAFGALAVLTALSMIWSIAPDLSWLEAARTTAYLAAFGSAMALARLVPDRWDTVLSLLGATAVILTGWALVVKVFTLGAGGQPQFGRLLAPFGYWNATGLIAGMGMPALLWAGSRRNARPLTRALTLPALTVLGTVVILCYSRTALAAAVLGLFATLVFMPSRLRALLLLALAMFGAGAISAWALGYSALTSDHVALAARRSADGTFGIVLVIAVAVLAGIGFGYGTAVERISLSARVRQTVNLALLGALALVPVAVVAALAVSSRGLTGEISHYWHTLTSSQATVGDKASRLVDLANSRPRYWRQALSVADHHLLSGSGAGTFGIAHLRYPTATLTPVGGAQHAHSYVFETLSDLGLIGLALSTVLLLSWAMATRRTLSARTGASEPERDALWAMLGIVVAFGFSSSFDWTWFYPGLTVPALICAGWVAGRGSGTRGRVAGGAAARTTGSAAAAGRAAAAVRAPGSAAPLSRRPGATAGLTAILIVTIGLLWGILEPLRSADATNAGISAMVAGHAGQAIADARTAAAADPLSLEPLQELSAFLGAVGDQRAARAQLVKATRLQPQNPLPWSWLGSYELQHGQLGPARRALQRASALDITNLQTAQQLKGIEARSGSGQSQ
ncbi:MAG TPA: O-antigen ligase family protein [Solirubrobacteraceae bacterium]|nr:O-antigen ligase family protein [Solirubrobacteraceae bacterium]